VWKSGWIENLRTVARKALRSEGRSGLVDTARATGLPEASRLSMRGRCDNPDRRGSERVPGGATFFRPADQRIAERDAGPTQERSAEAVQPPLALSSASFGWQARLRQRRLESLRYARKCAVGGAAAWMSVGGASSPGFSFSWT
jgi:hypothetical protein